jgi:hypothetical protein
VDSIAPDKVPEVPSSDSVEQVAVALRSHNIEAIIVDTADAAREAVLGMIPDGAEVHWGKSRTLEDIGLVQQLIEPGRFDALRPRMAAMDRATQAREMRKMVSAPDYMLGSVAAVTVDGTLVVASATGSQIGPFAAAAGRVVLVIGSQKIVPDLDAALRRIHDLVYPWELEAVRAKLGVDTILEKVLVIYGEWLGGRTTVVLVREAVGV